MGTRNSGLRCWHSGNKHGCLMDVLGTQFSKVGLFYLCLLLPSLRWYTWIHGCFGKPLCSQRHINSVRFLLSFWLLHGSRFLFDTGHFGEMFILRCLWFHHFYLCSSIIPWGVCFYISLTSWTWIVLKI